ncbi:MAG: hypothetical protein AAF990_22080 [Bacteroidota bacterium]
MYKNNLIQLLKSFSRKEMTRFREFVASPYFNKHREVRRLVVLLEQYYPDFNAANCDRHQLYQSLYPGEKHEQAQLALLFTYALRLVERFLTHEQLRDYGEYEKILLLRQLRQKQCFRLYDRKMKELDKLLQTHPHRNSVYYNYHYLRAEEADTYYTQLTKREMDFSIQEKQNNLDQYYLVVKLKDACEMLLRSRILKVEYSTGLLDIVVQEMEKQLDLYQSNPSIIVYYHIYQLLLNEKPEDYQDILPMIEQHAQYFSVPELQSIYNYLQNFCIKQVNLGSQRFLQASFELFKIQLDRRLLLDDDGYLPEWHYKNIVANGLRLGETQWVQQFIEGYKSVLRPEAQENAYTYNLASYYYGVRQYDKVLELLLRIEYTDLYYNLDSKAILLRTYYDLDEYEAFLSLNQAFQQFVRRNRLVSDFQRKGYINMLQLTKRIFQIKNNTGIKSREDQRQSLENLHKQLAQTNPVHNRSWLVRQIEELGGGEAVGS